LPTPDKRFAKIGGQLARVLTTKFLRAGESAALAANWIVDGVARVIVFDDLERSKLSVVEVFGVLNSLIEHDGRRIVVIGNENELTKNDDYRRVREKVIGITFELSEQVSDALQHFIARIDDLAVRTFFSDRTEMILIIFEQSDTKNLRILDQSLRAWARVYKVINTLLKAKVKGIDTAFRLFLALSLEVRVGRIGREDFNDRLDHIVGGSMSKRDNGGVGTPLSDAQDRYPRLHLHDSILSDKVLVQVLCDGLIDESEINSSLSVHELFVEPDEEPNWRKVWHGFLRPE